MKKGFSYKGVYTTYLEYSRDKKKTILFIHGFGVRARTYKATLKALAEKYHVIAPDVPGFGNSMLPEWRTKDYIEYFGQMDADIIIDIDCYGCGHNISIPYRLGVQQASYVYCDICEYGEGVQVYYIPGTLSISRLQGEQ